MKEASQPAECEEQNLNPNVATIPPARSQDFFPKFKKRGKSPGNEVGWRNGVTTPYALVQNFSEIHRGYHTAARRYEFYFRVVKTIF